MWIFAIHLHYYFYIFIVYSIILKSTHEYFLCSTQYLFEYINKMSTQYLLKHFLSY